MYHHVSNKVWLCQRTKKLWPENEVSLKFILILHCRERSTSYWNHKFTRHMASWFKTLMPNIICKCQTKQKLQVELEAMLKKTYKFDLNDQIKIILESRIYAPHSLMGIHTCQISYVNAREKRSNGPYTNLHRRTE